MMRATIHDTRFTDWPLQEKEDYYAKGLWHGQRLTQILKEQAQLRPAHIALIDDGKRMTYHQLYKLVNQLSNGLLKEGLKPGDNAIIHMPNCADFYMVYFALMAIGVRPVLALATHRSHEITHFIEACEAKHYFTAANNDKINYLDIAHAIKTHKEASQHGAHLNIYCLGDIDSNIPATPLQRIFSIHDTPPDVHISAEDIAFFQLSGGTTGVPKLIPRTHNDYLCSVVRSAEICELSPSDTFLTVLPQSHNFPLSSPGALGVFYSGGTVVMSQGGEPAQAFQLIEAHRVTVVALVPPLAIIWLEYAKAHKYLAHSLRLMQIGGAKLSHEIARQIEPTFHCTLQQVFGMAEGLVNYTRLDDSEDVKTKSQGRPMHLADQIKVVDDNDESVPLGSAGHLLTKGPYTIQGYYNAPAHNAKSFTQDGFYRTGDIVALDAQGNLTVEGRSKDQINRGGEKIAAEEIENALLKHPAVQDVAVVAMPDDLLGEKTCAFYQLTPKQARPSMMALNRFIYTLGLADYKLPDRYEVLEAFPQTKFGKINKQALRDDIAKKLSDLKIQAAIPA